MEQQSPGVPLTPHGVIAQRVRQLRDGRGWSAERLAQEMTSAGVPWTRIVVTKLETRRRPSISVEELLALAYALGVAPVDLLVPGDADEEPYDVTPTVTEPAAAVREWIAGGFLRVPANEYELALALQWVPKKRGRKLAREWWTPKRQVDSIRAANAELVDEHEQRESGDE